MRAKRDRRTTDAAPAAAAGGTDRLAGIPRLALDDDDERPSREDLDYGQTIFTRRPVPLPRLLTGRRRRPPGPPA